MNRPSGEKARVVLEILLLAGVYLAAARAGLALDAVSGFATLVWPASGIALAALVLRGRQLWPGILIGAFVANYWNEAAAIAAVGIAVGNTLEPLTGWLMLRRLGFDPRLQRVRDALGLIALAALGSTIISASIGVATLYLAGVVPPGRALLTWRAWWIGDAIGVLIVAPMFFVWARSARDRWRLPRALEAGALAVAAAVTSVAVFGSAPQLVDGDLSAVYLLFPILIWASLRFGPRGAVATGFLVSAIAIWGAVAGRGPFVHAELHQTLLALQTFIGVQAATFMLLGASVAERRAAEDEAREASAAALAASAAKSEFLAVVSHELRTPLNAISGYVELMQMQLYGPLSAPQTEALRRIQRSQQHLLTLVDDILGLAKLESGKMRLVPELLAADACAEVEQIVRPEANRKDLRLAVECATDVTVFADRERLRQVLLNVVANAIKFTPKGSVVLSAMRDGAGARLEVADTGIGIAAEQLDRVFEPFVQAEDGRSRNYPGIGLGLAVVRDLVTAMNGKVWIKSEPGVGTRVSIALPAAPTSQLEREQSGQARQLSSVES